MNSSNLKRYFQFMLVVIAAGAIYPVVYLRTNYQETILAVFDMTLTQLNTIYSVLGLVFMIGYFPSGLLSDKFSAKKLLAVSLLGTCVGGFWFARVPDYKYVLVIFCIWGIFSVFTFWSAHMKLVKLLSTPAEEGRFFGILDGGRGVIEAALASIAVAIFSSVLGKSVELADKKAALVSVIYMYSIILLVAAILVMIFIKDTNEVKSSDGKPAKEKFEFRHIAFVFKNKFVFLLGGIIFLSYSVTWTIYYFGGFMETNIKVDAVSVGKLMVIALWMRPIGGIAGGFLADKFGKSTVLAGALFSTALCLISMSVLPASAGRWIFFALIICAAVFIYAIRGTYWSLLGDCRIDNKIMGVAIGTISVMGYLPDIILPQFNSLLFSTFGGNGGYNAYFISSAIFGIIGMFLVLFFGRQVKNRG